MKTLNLALDSRPLSRGIFDSTDYTGLQLYGLEHLALYRAIEEIVAQDDDRRWTIKLRRELWDNGCPITAGDYLAGFHKLMGTFPWIKQITLRTLRSIEHSAAEMRFTFAKSFPRFRSLTELPNWAPLKQDRFSGPFRLQARDGGWDLESPSSSVGQVKIVHSPQENLEAFQIGEIDVTADTALPLDQIDHRVQRADTGLFAMLVFSRTLASPQALVADLDGCSLGHEIEAHYEPIAPTAVAPTEGQRRITLAYDAFYPNLQICEHVAQHLRAKGWEVELAQDDYYRPACNWDVKFMILRAMANNDLFKAASLFSLPAAPAQRSLLSKKYQEVESGLSFTYDVYAKLNLGYPLVKIPSLYYSRLSQTNPLLRGFA